MKLKHKIGFWLLKDYPKTNIVIKHLAGYKEKGAILSIDRTYNPMIQGVIEDITIL